MSKIQSYIRDVYHLATIAGFAFAAWKVVRYWRFGFGKKTGRDLDASIRAAAEKLEKTAISLEKWADTGAGENFGKGLDEVLTDAKKTLDNASGLIHRALTPHIEAVV